MLLLDGQVHHDTHAIPMGNYVSEVGNYMSANPSDLGNYVSADNGSTRCTRHCTDGTCGQPPSGGCSDDGFIDFRAGLIAQGRDWYQRVAASPDSLAGHPAVADAPDHPHGGPLFYELVNYAAHDAFERVTGGTDSFYDAWSRYRGSRGHSDPSPADMGEDFDFDDAQEMRRRLPRLSALYLRNVST